MKVMAPVKATALALEAGKTLIFDRVATIFYADQEKITIVSWHCVPVKRQEERAGKQAGQTV